MYVQKEELLELAVNIGLFCAASLLKVSLYQVKIVREEWYIVRFRTKVKSVTSRAELKILQFELQPARAMARVSSAQTHH